MIFSEKKLAFPIFWFLTLTWKNYLWHIYHVKCCTSTNICWRNKTNRIIWTSSALSGELLEIIRKDFVLKQQKNLFYQEYHVKAEILKALMIKHTTGNNTNVIYVKNQLITEVEWLKVCICEQILVKTKQSPDMSERYQLLNAVIWKHLTAHLLVRNHIDVSFVGNNLLKLLRWDHTWKATLDQYHTILNFSVVSEVIDWRRWSEITHENSYHRYVSYVGNYSLVAIVVISWEQPWEPKLERGQSHVSYVISHLPKPVIWSVTWDAILDRSHTNASCVRNHLLKVVNLNYTWEPILERSHTNVSYVRSRFL